MTLRSADRVRDTTTTTGTGSLTISGTAPIGYRAFSAIPSIAAADTFLAMTAHQTLNEWEVGLYSYTNATTLARPTILSSSNAGAAVNFSAGTKDVVLVQAAGRQVLTTDQQVPLINGGDAAASVLTLQSTSGVGTTDAISLKTGSQLERMRIDSKGNIVHGAAALAVGATDGFMHLETCPGPPTGTPTAYTGRAPFVLDSVNNVLNFYSGGAWRRSGRPQSAAALVFYVRTDGNDNNTGLVNNAGGAWLTIDHAIDVIQSLDLNHQTVTVNIAAGTYACAPMYLAYLTNPDAVNFTGDTTTPANVTLSFASGNIYCVGDPWTWQFNGIKFTNASGGIFVDCDGGFLVLDRCEWGTGTGTHIFVHNDGTAYCLGNHTISGASFANHWSAQSGGLIRHRGITINFTGTPTCTGAFIEATGATCQVDGITFTGTLTGKRYTLGSGGRFQTNNDSLTYFPGSTVAVPYGDDFGGIYNGLIRSAGLTTDSAGQVAVPATTAATSTTTGALKISGGVGIAGALYVGGLLDVGGALDCSAGLLTVNGQIQFPAAQNASAGANVLDDYEEGTWTPSVGGSATYNTQQGYYTKIGRLVHVHCNITINLIGTGSTTVISGLPFAISSSTSFVHASVAGWFSAAGSFVHVGVQGSGGASSVTVQAATAAAASTGTPAFFANGTALGFSLVYMV
jgi:hypothetical protein